MDNSIELQKVIARFGPLSYPQIDLTKRLRNIYVAEGMKLNFCKALRTKWPQLHSDSFVNDMFTTIKTGNDILLLINPLQV